MPNGNVSTLDIINAPQPSKEAGQRSMRVSDAYFTRMIPGWSQPSILTPGQWRAWVAAQPIAVTCRDTMISNLSDLDWKITPRKSDMRDELKGTIDYYEKFLRNGGYSGLDWISFLEWFVTDLNDLPFGTGWEIGRKGDSENGRAMWLEPLDGGTLYPTNNKDTPVIQYYNGYYASFPKHAIARAYMSPRPEIERKGWGVAPPEKVFLAMEMLARGDRYYANLLLDIPPAGVFDLGDITWEDANTWIESFRTFTQGGTSEGFKIPVLAEHTGKVQFIPLGKAPNDIMYDRITLKYAALIAAAYGMSLSDIGLSAAGGDTLAGSIRGEQKTNRTGKARNKGKIKYFVENIIPSVLQFDFIDTDGERLSMLGRARLANATAMNQYHQMGSISPEEARLQAIQDGLFTISMPEKPPKEAEPKLPATGKVPERPGSVGSPQPPSLGGDGEMKKSLIGLTIEKGRSFNARIGKLVKRICEDIVPILTESSQSVSTDELYLLRSAVDDSIFGTEDVFNIAEILKAIWVQDNWVSVKDTDLPFELKALFTQKYIWELTDEDIDRIDFAPFAEELKHRVSSEIKTFIGKYAVSMLKDQILSETAFDNDAVASYDNMVNTIRNRIVENFGEFSSACVELEANKILEEIKEEKCQLEK